jgi:hypothetical protein
VYQIGETAANLLFERISRGQFPTKGHRVVLPLELVIRRSCGCHAPAGDVAKPRQTAAQLTSARQKEKAVDDSAARPEGHLDT